MEVIMNYKIFIVLLLFVSMIGLTTAADFQAPMNGTDQTYYNVSYQKANGSFTPFSVWIFVACAGFYLMLISFLAKPEQNADIFAYLAVPALGLAAYQSLALDVITGSGVTSQAGKYVLLENHTIYSITGVTIIFVILLIVSLLNVYRVVMLNRDPNEVTYEDSPY
jgi:hypothetical protein